jgi:hypothetical protein
MAGLSVSTKEIVAATSSTGLFVLLDLDGRLCNGGNCPLPALLLIISVRWESESADLDLGGGFLCCDGDTGDDSADLDFEMGVDCRCWQ